MRCRDVERLATAYVDGELDDRRSSALRGHLRVCHTCAARVEDEAALRDAAGRLAPLEPPPDLWRAIDGRLAEAEIADSRRSPFWLWAQRALDLVRARALPIGVGAAAAAALVAVSITRSGARSGEPRPGRRAEAAAAARGDVAVPPPALAAAGPVAAVMPADRDPCAATGSFDDQTRCEIQRADRRYLQAITRLSAAVAQERSTWSPAQAARFDAAVAALDRAATDEVKRLAVAPGRGAEPADRDPLYSIYRRKIDLLSRAAAGERIAVRERDR